MRQSQPWVSRHRLLRVDPSARHHWPRGPKSFVPSGHGAYCSGVVWLARLFSLGTRDVERPYHLGDEIWAAGEAWNVTAVVSYASGTERWLTFKLTRGFSSAWITANGNEVTRYDPLPDVRVDEGRAVWNGRTYERSERGTLTITDVSGDVEGARGDRAEYETLRCPQDDSRWISVERWIGGRSEVSAGRRWHIERVVRGQTPVRPH
jgi:hypothetical protein